MGWTREQIVDTSEQANAIGTSLLGPFLQVHEPLPWRAFSLKCHAEVLLPQLVSPIERVVKVVG